MLTYEQKVAASEECWDIARHMTTQCIETALRICDTLPLEQQREIALAMYLGLIQQLLTEMEEETLKHCPKLKRIVEQSRSIVEHRRD